MKVSTLSNTELVILAGACIHELAFRDTTKTTVMLGDMLKRMLESPELFALHGGDGILDCAALVHGQEPGQAVKTLTDNFRKKLQDTLNRMEKIT